MFKIGDRVKHAEHGEGTVISNTEGHFLPVLVKFDQKSGRLHSGNSDDEMDWSYWYFGVDGRYADECIVKIEA